MYINLKYRFKIHILGAHHPRKITNEPIKSSSFLFSFFFSNLAHHIIEGPQTNKQKIFFLLQWVGCVVFLCLLLTNLLC